MSDGMAFSSVDQSNTGAFSYKIILDNSQWAAVPFGLVWDFSANLSNLLGRKPAPSRSKHKTGR